MNTRPHYKSLDLPGFTDEERYYAGNCNILAVALSYLFEFPISVMTQPNEGLYAKEHPRVLDHAFVTPKPGWVIDVYGLRPLTEILYEFTPLSGLVDISVSTPEACLAFSRAYTDCSVTEDLKRAVTYIKDNLLEDLLQDIQLANVLRHKLPL